MRGYDRYDEYEDLDEYEEDGDEQEGEDAGEDEYEEEEAPKPTKEVLDYLELRQRLKEEKRKKLKKELGTANGSSRERKNVIAKDSFGSFFGPSQPVIAERVIQESKSLLENPNLAARIIKSNQSGNKRSAGSAPSASKPQASGQRPKVTNGVQKKVDMIKKTRDYSFLLSDDAEIPAPIKVPPQNVSVSKPEARSAQPLERSSRYQSINERKFSTSREDNKPAAAINRMQGKVGSDRFASGGKPVQPTVDSRKHLGRNNGTLADHRKQPSSSNGSGPSWSVVSKSVPSKSPVGTTEKKISVAAARTYASGLHKPNPLKLHAPVSRQSSSRKEEHQATGKPKVATKRPVPPPKPKQLMRPQMKPSARDSKRDERPRNRPVRHDEDDYEDDEDPEKALKMIRNMFGYNPRRYEDVDDDSDMEANFDDIMREEKKSARIARREDEEELRKIEEEERRERLRKEARKRKLSHR